MVDDPAPQSQDSPHAGASNLTDPMTGLLNRNGFLLALQHRGGEPVGVIFGDVDGFMAINDIYGHAEGNRILEQIGQRVAAGAPTDAVVGRLGGDQFVVFLPGTDDFDVVHPAALAMLHTCDSPFAVGDGVVKLDFSVGVAIAPPNELLKGIGTADAAMMAAKGRGGARAVCLEPAWEAR